MIRISPPGRQGRQGSIFGSGSPGVPGALAVLSVSLVGLPTPAHATGFSDLGRDVRPRTETAVTIDGGLRLRGQLFHNFDLDRGLDPSGQPLFPVPLADPTAQAFAFADARLRTDLAVFPPFGGLAVKARLDVLDDLVLGSTPEGDPAGSTRQRPPPAGLRLERAWGEAVTPVGVLAAGRMGSHWGLGMATNGGDCEDCDAGDTADRIAFVTPLAGHLWAIAYDFTASGPVVERPLRARVLDVEPMDDVRTVTFALLAPRTPEARDRRRLAGKATLEYGAYASYRWQTSDIPAATVDTGRPVVLDAGQVVPRGASALGCGAWVRLTMPHARVELEPAALFGRADEASRIPGVDMRDVFTSTQLGAALESELGAPEGPFGAGLDLGFASGDPAPGFGAFARPDAPAPRPGQLDGPQATPRRDDRIDNFRFHADYRIDRILFREIIGTVTDAWYLRPHARVRAARFGAGELSASLAAILSFAVEATSTPGGESPLGLELDPTIRYESKDGFLVAVEYAVLFPFSGLDNPSENLPAKPAQLARIHLGYGF